MPTFKGRLESVAVGPYAPLARKLLRGSLHVSKRFVDDSKVSDHHAIIPTDEYVNISALNSDERRLYDLIVRRFLSLFFPPLRYEETSVVLIAGSERFAVKGRVLKEEGWKEVYAAGGSAAYAADTAEESDGSEEADGERSGRESVQLLPPLQLGQSLRLNSCRSKQSRTLPPARFTEAGLLTVMEKHSLRYTGNACGSYRKAAWQRYDRETGCSIGANR